MLANTQPDTWTLFTHIGKVSASGFFKNITLELCCSKRHVAAWRKHQEFCLLSEPSWMRGGMREHEQVCYFEVMPLA